MREGDLLQEAVQWCRERGVEFYAVNSNYPEETEAHEGYSRKLKADLFIDDRNVGGLPDWSLILRMVNEGKSMGELYAEQQRAEGQVKKKSWWRR